MIGVSAQIQGQANNTPHQPEESTVDRARTNLCKDAGDPELNSSIYYARGFFEQDESGVANRAPAVSTASPPPSHGNQRRHYHNGDLSFAEDGLAPITLQQHKNPSAGRLRVQTDLAPRFTVTSEAQSTVPSQPAPTGMNLRHSGSASALRPGSSGNRFALSPAITPLGSCSPASNWSSPALSAVADVTPLPSPIAPGSSPGPWNRMGSRPDLNGSDFFLTKGSDSGAIPLALPPKRKPYNGLTPAASEASQTNTSSHARNRSISEFAADAIHVPRARIPTISGSTSSADAYSASGPCMKREEYLAEQRGLSVSASGILTPPPSDRGTDSGDGDVQSVSRGDEKVVLPIAITQESTLR